MKGKNEGFSLIEILVAITILGLFFVTACSAFVLGRNLNVKTEATLQAQLAVSSAVEILMAEGIISPDDESYKESSDCFDKVEVTIDEVKEANTQLTLPYFKVTVKSIKQPDISVTTYIRKAVSEP